jgi:hypothetical protein
LRHEPQKPGREGREESTIDTPGEVNTAEENLTVINVIQQNPVIISGQRVKVGSHKDKGEQHEPDKPKLERWL